MRLPQLTAVEFRAELKTGTTRPCVFLCEDAKGNTGEYVTKMRGDVRGTSGLCFEYVAACLARHFGIDIPEPALIELQLDLAVAQKRNEELCDRIIRSVGLNFGTSYLSGFPTWLPDQRVPGNLLKEASSIVAFDALIDNADRRREKPNLLAGADRLIVIDHELAFGFVRLIGTQPAWRDRLQFLSNHPLFKGLRGRPLDLGSFRGRLTRLTDAAIDEICSSVPADFGREYVEAIARHLRDVREDAESFLSGVQEVIR